MFTCDWCLEKKAKKEQTTVYWELITGTQSIEIIKTPSFSCEHCGMTYQKDETVKEIEDQLILVDQTKLPEKISYEELMSMKRLLKRNYFDFSS
ncbi:MULTISPECIES: YokU family protein [unclassified Bacillus (in: firmicutes)]|uniref:YokU family protein n=1 Tax=Bacillus TaxID=1386 RepID=UPI00338F1D74